MNNFPFTLFIGRLTRLTLLQILQKEIKHNKNIKDVSEAKRLLNDIVDSERASMYLYKNPERIVIP